MQNDAMLHWFNEQMEAFVKELKRERTRGLASGHSHENEEEDVNYVEYWQIVFDMSEKKSSKTQIIECYPNQNKIKVYKSAGSQEFTFAQAREALELIKDNIRATRFTGKK